MSMKKSATPWLELESSPVQQIVPPGRSQRFEGVDFAGCGNILAIATSDANTILLFRRRPDGRFDDAPYQTIGGGAQIEYPHDVAFSRATADELLAVAQRPGRITIHARDGADGRYSAAAVSEISGTQSGLAYSDAVAFVPPDESHLASCSLERGTISFFRRTSAAPPAFAAAPVFQLRHRSISTPTASRSPPAAVGSRSPITASRPSRSSAATKSAAPRARSHSAGGRSRSSPIPASAIPTRSPSRRRPTTCW